jgi:hypothetical protein
LRCEAVSTQLLDYQGLEEAREGRRLQFTEEEMEDLFRGHQRPSSEDRLVLKNSKKIWTASKM